MERKREPGARVRAAAVRLGAIVLAMAAVGCGATPERGPGEVASRRLPERSLEKREAAERAAAARLGSPAAEQILFGDLHVHSTFSVDAFFFSLPLLGGEGAHPPADACDYARVCAGLDFFALTDHAEGLTPALWREIKSSLRQCNAVAGDPANPDLVAFVGWEWTQIGPTPESHFGHRNVIFPGLADDELPARPIAAPAVSEETRARVPPGWVMHAAAGALRLLGYGPYGDAVDVMARIAALEPCPQGVSERSLPEGCHETAATPAELFRKLDDWGFDVLVIPHGLAWGIHAPPGATIRNQLSRAQHDPSKQRLLEIASGHGNSEEYRSYPEYVTDASGRRVCPEPTADYLPCCWRAGQIMRARCGDLPPEECERRVEEARRLALEAGVSPDQVFPDTRGEDWLDCDQCRDCFKPAMTLRPRETAQYAAAISSFDERDARGRPLRFRWGFIASSDNHQARAATGFKQVHRHRTTDANGFVDAETAARWRGWLGAEQRDPTRAQRVETNRLFDLVDTERKASFLYPGGTVAVHATGRDRRSIWQALERREVYGTSGPRILLYFDLVNAPGGRAPMGSEVEMAETPRFEVRAAGAFVQKPGCPPGAGAGLSPERFERLCGGECYNPGDERRRIEAIEVVRIRPQVRPDEDVAGLIEDPWRRFSCPADPAGCRVVFEDPDFLASGRDALYYVRALQEPTPAINGANLRTEFDASGRAVRISQCHGGFGTPADDDCLAPVRERAWSSPIYVDRTSAG